jgi:hypothetical protein
MKWANVPLHEIPTEGLKHELRGWLIETSTWTGIVSRDDDTPILVFGARPVTQISSKHFIWLVPYESIRPHDLWGIRRVFKLAQQYTPHMQAIVRIDDAKAEQLVKLLGGMCVGEWTEDERIYEWLA